MENQFSYGQILYELDISSRQVLRFGLTAVAPALAKNPGKFRWPAVTASIKVENLRRFSFENHGSQLIGVVKCFLS